MTSPALSLPVSGPDGRALKAPEECTLLERSRRRGRWREAGISGESGSFFTTILGACEFLAELGERFPSLWDPSLWVETGEPWLLDERADFPLGVFPLEGAIGAYLELAAP